ncbi:MAG: outer membrane beta-barrel protein [Pseudomonadota bacterium]
MIAKRLTCGRLVLAMATAIPAATAQDIEQDKNYVRAALGFGRPIAFETVATIDPAILFAVEPVTSNSVDAAVGLATGFLYGRPLGHGVSVEAEYRFFRSEIDEIEFLDGFDPATGGIPDPLSDPSGLLRTHALMANVSYSLDTTGRFHPFVSAGIGAANVDGQGALSQAVVPDDATWSFAFQGRLGVIYDLTPKWSVGADYAYFGATSPDFDADDVAVGPFIGVEREGFRVSTFSFSIQRSF